jgi:excisionase family DNA binding protein
MATLTEQTVLPQATSTYAALEAVLRTPQVQVSVAGEGEGVALGDDLRLLLADAVAALERGEAVTLIPRPTTLTTQQAADLLGVSRPTLVKLLVEGQIPYEQPGRHRRIRLADLLRYKTTIRDRRAKSLTALAEDDFDMPDSDTYVRTR